MKAHVSRISVVKAVLELLLVEQTNIGSVVNTAEFATSSNDISYHQKQLFD